MRTSILLGGVQPLASGPRSPYGLVCWDMLLGLVAPVESSAEACTALPLVWRRVLSSFM
jgi:hypothetical protein